MKLEEYKKTLTDFMALLDTMSPEELKKFQAFLADIQLEREKDKRFKEMSECHHVWVNVHLKPNEQDLIDAGLCLPEDTEFHGIGCIKCGLNMAEIDYHDYLQEKGFNNAGDEKYPFANVMYSAWTRSSEKQKNGRRLPYTFQNLDTARTCYAISADMYKGQSEDVIISEAMHLFNALEEQKGKGR